MRQAVTGYKIPDSDVVIDKGTRIFVSVDGLHTYPKYFNRPDEFYPENFSLENMKNLPQCAFMPFSMELRNCIGR